MTPYAFGVLIGFILGMMCHNLILQVAYRLGVVEYKGRLNETQTP